MTRMPSLLRPAIRLLLAVGVVAAGLVAATAVAQTPAAVPVTVTIQPAGGGSPVAVSLDQVNPDIRDQRYRVGSQTIAVARGVSVYQLLDHANANFDYAEIEIPRPGGGTLRMSKDQVEDTKPAGFYTDEQGVTHFIGPTGDDGSVALDDYFPVETTIELTQLRQSKLQVSISPTKKKIELGGSVSFRATVTGNDDGENVTFTWGIKGRKQTLGGPGFTQKFPSKDGVYEFLVAVRFEGSEPSTSDVATITVGDPEKAKREQAGSGDSDDGGSTGGGTGSSGGGSSYDSGSSYTPSYTPVPSTPAPAPAPTPSAEPPDAPDIATSGTTVEGNLLADVSDPPPSNILESAARAAREGKQQDDDAGPDGAGVSEAALSIFGVLALLALGAGIETRQGRLPRWRLPRSPRRAA